MELAGLIVGIAGVVVTLASMLTGRRKLIVAIFGVLLILVAAGLVVSSRINSGGAGHPSPSPSASASPTPSATPSSDDDVLLEDDFHTADHGWQLGHDDERGAAHYELGRMRVEPKPGFAKWMTAPIQPVPANVRITAKAHLEAGQGGWGIWCRGTAGNSRQYEFSVTHAGDAYIKNGYERRLGKTNIPGFDITRENTMTVDCRDADGDVHLTMSMNGEQILSAQGSDGDGGLLGPGPVGLHAFAFGDTDGAPADVRFSYFKAVRLH